MDEMLIEPTGSALTLWTRLERGAETAITELLEDAGRNIGERAEFPLRALRRVHFLRWLVIPVDEDSHFLAFESNFDGTEDEHLRELVDVCGVGIRRIYAACIGSPCANGGACSDDALLAYLKAQALRPAYAAYHVAHRTASVGRILLDDQVRKAVMKILDEDDTRLRRLTPSRIHAEIRARLAPSLIAELEAGRPERPHAWSYDATLAVAAGVAVVVSPALLGWLGWLTYRDWHVDRPSGARAHHDHVKPLAQREDHKRQNQLTHFVAIKPGRLRHYSLRFVLWAIDLLARRVFNQGALGDIRSIHFARWVFVGRDAGSTGDTSRPAHERLTHLLFFSNYDGSWESYLGDFVDMERKGLTGVWSNTRDYPRTTMLLWGGAQSEDQFKAWTRAHQLPTQLWYSAYPDLTVDDISTNAAIAEGLAKRHPTPREVRAWLCKL